jgi:hypothetical protein
MAFLLAFLSIPAYYPDLCSAPYQYVLWWLIVGVLGYSTLLLNALFYILLLWAICWSAVLLLRWMVGFLKNFYRGHFHSKSDLEKDFNHSQGTT